MAIRVLVVHDVEAARAAVKALLSAKGYEVDQAVDGQAALERIVELPPDVVVTDLDMPRLDGQGLLKHMHENDPELGLVFLFYYVIGQNVVYSAIYASGLTLAGLILTASSLSKIEMDRILVIYVVSFFVIFFWAAFEQAGS